MSVFTVALLVGFLAGSRVGIGAQGDCSQPVTAGPNPLATDCLFILRVAVNLQACTSRACVCDPSGDGTTKASDALICLKKAVGQSVILLCRCNTTTSTTTTTTMAGGGANCTNNGNCRDDDCVCSDCDNDIFCGDPANCQDDGICNAFSEGCVCADCKTNPECLDN